jgi:hypothetical protein
VGKKYPLITYEKALLSQATGGKFPSVTFIERKQMSTKTSIKRIALVAAAALTLGGFSAVSAHATASYVTVTQSVTHSAAGTGPTATGVIGGQVTFTYEAADTSTTYVTTDAGGYFNGKPTASSSGTVVYTNSIDATSGVTYTAAAAADLLTVKVSSQVAGTQVVTIKTLATVTGVATVVAKVTITWATSAAAGLTAANSLMYISSTTCSAFLATNTSHAADVVTAANDANAITSSYKTGDVHVCISTRDGSGSAIAVKTTSTVLNSFGQSASASAAAVQDILLSNPNSVTGTGTFTAILTDNASNTITLTTPFTYYSTLASLTLVNIGYSAQYGGAGAVATGGTTAIAAIGTTSKAVPGLSTSALALVGVVGKDSNGNIVDLANATEAALLKPFTIDSDGVTGAPSAKSSDSLGAGAGYSTDAAGLDISGAVYGTNIAYVDCANSTKAEKITLTANAVKSDLTTAVTSNSVTIYCADNSVKGKVTVTPADSAIDANASTTVQVSVLDPSGYVVPDGTSVSMSANQGAGINTPSTTTVNGAFKYAATLLAGQGTTTVLAVGPKGGSGTATVSVTGGTADSSALSLDAANAATDAANNAYDEAQNATQAASDALAAVTALSAQVGALIATVKSLAAVVAKIKAKVKA